MIFQCKFQRQIVIVFHVMLVKPRVLGTMDVSPRNWFCFCTEKSVCYRHEMKSSYMVGISFLILFRLGVRWPQMPDGSCFVLGEIMQHDV